MRILLPRECLFAGSLGIRSGKIEKPEHLNFGVLDRSGANQSIENHKQHKKLLLLSDFWISATVLETYLTIVPERAAAIKVGLHYSIIDKF